MPLTPEPTAASTAREIVRGILARELRGQDSDAARVEAAAQVLARISVGLSRWFGPYGSVALVNRALARAQEAHPALRDVTAAATPAARLAAVGDSVQRHGAAVTADGVIATLTILAEVISRLIGNDLASNLLEQSSKSLDEADPTNRSTSSGEAPSGTATREAHQPVKEP